jgi:lysophospholipase L1-like esterase
MMTILKLYVLGDSISIHYGPFLQAYLKGVMEYSRKEGEEEALLNLDNPQGANGGDSSMVLSFLTAKARSGGIDADLLLLNCGLHDIKTDLRSGRKQVPIIQYEDNLRAILKTVRGPRPKLIWIRTTLFDEAIHNSSGVGFHRYAVDCIGYNRVADRVMEESGVPIVDLCAFTLNLGSDLYCDHVHFHEHIREKQAAFIAGWLFRFMEQQEIGVK